MRIPWATFLTVAALIFGAVIGWRIYEGKVHQKKLAEAASLCRERAEQGDAKAQTKLASMYYYAKGLPQNYAAAVDWYRKAAEQGNADAQYGLSFMYREGKGVTPDPTEAVSWCHRAAEQGNARAQYAMGNVYYDGWQVSQDYVAAGAWYRKSAEQGYAEAQYTLGYLYYEGKGVPQDNSEAVAWYRKAAEQRYARGQSALGYMYFQGKGVQRNYAEAAQWYRRAAKQGDEPARRAIAAMRIRFSAPTKITLSLVALGSIFFLSGFRGDFRDRQQRTLALAGLLGLSWVGLDMYGNFNFGTLLALSAVNAFYFGKSVLSGICCAMFLSIVWQQGFKIVLAIGALLFVGFNVYAMTHYDLRHFAGCPRAFYFVNGFLIGIAITSAFLLWAISKQDKRTQGSKGVVAL